MAQADIYHLSFGAYDGAVDYEKKLAYIIGKNIENISLAGCKWRFQTSDDETAIVTDMNDYITDLESWADGAFTVGDKDSRDLPVPIPQASLTSLCALLPPPFNMVAAIVLQIGLRILDSKLEAASNRADLEPLLEVLEEIRDKIEEGLSSPTEGALLGLLRDAVINGLGSGDDAFLVRLAEAQELLRSLGVSMSVNELGRFKGLRLDFSGVSGEEVT